ncbi:hypothetical protein N5C66_08975 [Rhizobium pusense]|nr:MULTISPECIES: hypothetical protein [Rhizobium/Agrobacterium group]MDH0909107.1 hypothetical protein [Agrobacterium pusense]MDH1096893.1 hypothetical protein [Agrobacterium pusense]MDH1111858.1 hypothetical protein [Agrobacterium pusense]MDH2194048.1 hypothetical protein [Agrobacterium pusense]OJH50944.1 hypothetical protein ATN81_04125 [Agrobacterium pusense]
MFVEERVALGYDRFGIERKVVLEDEPFCAGMFGRRQDRLPVKRAGAKYGEAAFVFRRARRCIVLGVDGKNLAL